MAHPKRRHGFLAAAAALVLLAGALGCASDGGASATSYERERKARAHYAVAVNHMKEGRTALAIRELLTALDLDATDPWIHLSLAEAYRLKGKAEDSEKHLLEALRLEPGFQPALLNLSALYTQMGRHEDAVARSRQLLDDPTFPVPWKALGNMGWAQYRLGRKDEARQSFEHALDYHDDFPPALLGLAVLEADAGHKLEAMERLEKLIETGPGPLVRAEANYRIAEIYVSLGNRERAMHHLVAATEQKPSGEWGRRSEDYLKRLR
jgi:Tfp pilus assembly protein PilF